MIRILRKATYAFVNLLSVLAIVAALTALLSVVFTPSGEAPRILGFSSLRVLTGSMEPAIPVDSLVVVRQVDPAEVAPGDIISFYSADPSLEGALNTHRVVACEQTAEGWQFTTQGDANPIPDRYPVRQEDLVGRVVYTSLLLGSVVALLTQPIFFVLCVALPLVGMVIYNLYKTIQSAHKVMKEEEQAAMEQALRELRARQAAAQQAPAEAAEAPQNGSAENSQQNG